MSTASWAPMKRGRPYATIYSRRLSRALGRARSMSWTRTLRDALAPASRQTRAAALSNAKPLRPRTPCSGASCTVMATRIKWQATAAVTHGRRKLEPEASQQEDSKRLSIGHAVGTHVTGSPPLDHFWERNYALDGRDKRGHMAQLKKKYSTFWVAQNCHPCLLTPGPASSNSFSLGCAPRCRSSQGGTSNPTSRSRSLHVTVDHLTDLRVPRLHRMPNLPNRPQCSIVVRSASPNLRLRKTGWQLPKMCLALHIPRSMSK